MYPSRRALITVMWRSLQELEQDPQASHALRDLGLALGELMLQDDQTFQRTRLVSALLLQEQGEDLVAIHAPRMAHGRTGAGTSAFAHVGDAVLLALDETTAMLSRTVSVLAAFGDTDPAVSNWLDKVVDWENMLYERRTNMVASPGGSDKGEVDRQPFVPGKLSQYLEDRFPHRLPIRVRDVRAKSGGFAKTTVFVDISFAGAPAETLVIRADSAGPGLSFLAAARVDAEFPVLRFLHRRGARVAEPLWLETDSSHFGRQFLVSRRARGHNVGSRVDIDGRIDEALLQDLVEQLVAIHETPLQTDDPDFQQSHLAPLAALGSIEKVVSAQVEFWEKGLAKMRLPASPLRNRILEWLKANIPGCKETPVLTHGDFGLHNILIEDGKVSCVLDWEAVSLGDPADDLAWLIDGLKAQVEPGRIHALYENISGRKISTERLHFFSVLNALRFVFAAPRALQLFEENAGAGNDALEIGLRFTFLGTGDVNNIIANARKAASARRLPPIGVDNGD